MLPDGWKRSTIQEHIDLLTGYAFKSNEYTSNEQGIRLLRGDNIAQGYLRWRNCKFWPQNTSHELERYCLQSEDIVIAMDRTWIPAGVKVSQVKPEDLPCLLVQRVARLRAKKSLDQKLLKQILFSHQFSEYVKKVQTETAVPHISPSDIRELSIFLPPIAEQQKIAEILDTWDQAIETVEALIANSQAQKKALMQQLFPTEGKSLPKIRFPEFRDTPGWTESKLGELGELLTGLTYTPNDIRENGLLVLRSSNIQNGIISLNDNVYVTPAIKGVNLSKTNDILICVRNGSKTLIGKNALIPEGTPLCTHGAFMTVFRSKSWKFVFQLFQTSAYQKQVEMDLGATINSINGSQLLKYKFNIPSISEQKKIADCLSCIDDLITLQSQKLEALMVQKNGLMQQLLTGKRRVNVSAQPATQKEVIHA